MTRFFLFLGCTFFSAFRLLANNSPRWLLFSMLHATLLVAAGYALVVTPLPLTFKISIFSLVCFASVCRLYQSVMGKGKQFSSH